MQNELMSDRHNKHWAFPSYLCPYPCFRLKLERKILQSISQLNHHQDKNFFATQYRTITCMLISTIRLPPPTYSTPLPPTQCCPLIGEPFTRISRHTVSGELRKCWNIAFEDWGEPLESVLHATHPTTAMNHQIIPHPWLKLRIRARS